MELDVVGKKNLWLSISGGIIILGILAMIYSTVTIGTPFRLGIDFTGGVLLELKFEKKVPSVAAVREILEQKNLGNSSIQTLSTGKVADEIQIRTKPLTQEERLALQDLLKAKLGNFTIRRLETVGPTLGQELFFNSSVAVLVTLVAIAVYVGIRFQSDYATFALVAMLHDVLVLLGFFSVMGIFFNVEIDSLSIVALLTVIGFSITDTVVVYDRIRENMKFVSRKKSFGEIVNSAVNQTFGRSINTSLTALMTLFALFFFGGVTLKDFSLALIVGFSAGAYSSIFNASVLLVVWRDYQSAKALKAKNVAS
jgi:preprotein translocase subunit SecF